MDRFLTMAEWPVARPADWVGRVNRPMLGSEEEAMRRSIGRNRPLGQAVWQSATASRLGLEMSLRPPGRPREIDNGP